MRNSPFWWLLLGFMVLLDIYVFQVVKHLSQSASPKVRVIIFTVYWVVSIGALITLIILPYLQFEEQNRFFRNTIFACIAALFFAKVVASLFFLVDDVRRGIVWIAEKLGPTKQEQSTPTEDAITRSVFLSWAGTVVGAGLFGSLLYGFSNKYRYQLKHVRLAFENLPSNFKGLKVVHISDIHAGSFTDKQAVLRGVDKIMQQKPDLILFTGDLVNNRADEMEDYMDVFSRLNAPMGVYSVLGNHDYGEYVEWDSAEHKRQNLERLKQVHHDLGWKLLMNESVHLQKDDQQIRLIGIENWSIKASFPKYGDMKKAYNGTEAPFNILMSHDPSHWDAEIRKSYPKIDLTLAGHTHGMQFGVEIPGFRWSPVQYVYKQWAGLYEDGGQKLYVNRGFGFIGYPGRVGILPEITVIQLV